MRKFFAAAVGSVVALVGFAGAANASATIDLIWIDPGDGTCVADGTCPQIGRNISDVLASSAITLSVILTAGGNGSAGAGVSVDFSTIENNLVFLSVRNTPSDVNVNTLPITLDNPSINGSRAELINSACVCIVGVGTGLAEGESHQLGTVTIVTGMLIDDTYVIGSDADGLRDGVLDINTNDITDSTTFNTATLVSISGPDFDGDGVEDIFDNCSEAANAAQDDTDGDDCGNVCDADYDDSGVVGLLDFGEFGGAFGTTDEEKIHQGTIPGSIVSIPDLGVFGQLVNTAPGPSGTTAGTVACPIPLPEPS